MAKRKSILNYRNDDPISAWLGTLKYKDLKRAAILRGHLFAIVGENDVNSLQSWVYRHFEDPQDPRRLEEFDKWLEKTLIEEGSIDSPIHVGLKLGFYSIDDDGKEVRKRRDANLMGIKKTNAEVATFVPRRGSKKTLVFDLMKQGLATKEIIIKVQKEYKGTSSGTIKVWCSQARKVIKAKIELNQKIENHDNRKS